jgi:hypothetical protein
LPVPDLRWSRVLLIALLALVLFFGINYIYQRYFKQEPFLEELCRVEGVAGAKIVSENGSEILIITPEVSFQGQVQALVAGVEKEVSGRYRKPLTIEIKDQRSPQLDLFATAVSPDLYEAVRSGSYRAAAERIEETAAAYGLTGHIFTVDARYLYLQARDGANYLYLIVPLPASPEGGAADA